MSLSKEEIQEIADEAKQTAKEVRHEVSIRMSELRKDAMRYAIKEVYNMTLEEYYRSGGQYGRNEYWVCSVERDIKECYETDKTIPTFLFGSLAIFLITKAVFENLIY